MSNHNICFHEEIKKKSVFLVEKKHLIVFPGKMDKEKIHEKQYGEGTHVLARRPRSAFTSMQSDQGFHCLLTE